MRAYVAFQLVVACFVAAIACSDDDEGYSKCINGSCTDVGCESEEECRILLQAGRGVDAVYREAVQP